VFASREECGLAAGSPWNDVILGDARPPVGVNSQLSAWFALDVFVNNLYRHPDNFLALSKGNGQSFFGMDFGDALCVPGWPPPIRMGRCNTLAWRERLVEKFPLDKNRFTAALDKIGDMPESWMAERIAGLPDGWLGDTLSEQMRLWWRRDRHPRLAKIKQDMTDGYYI
jgi:hypothetical protein